MDFNSSKACNLSLSPNCLRPPSLLLGLQCSFSVTQRVALTHNQLHHCLLQLVWFPNPFAAFSKSDGDHVLLQQTSPILARFGYFFANLHVLWCIFYKSKLCGGAPKWTNMRYALAPLILCGYAPGPPGTCSVGVMKTAMDDIFMHDQQSLIAMINRSSS